MTEGNPGREDFDQAMRGVVGPTAWDGFAEEERKKIGESYLSALSFPSPISFGPDRYSILDSFAQAPDLGDAQLGDAFRGSMIRDGLTARLVWNFDRSMNQFGLYRELTGGVNQPMTRFDLERGRGLIEYTADQWFADNQERLQQTPSGRQLLDRYVVGDFDQVVDSTHLAALIGHHEEEIRLEGEASKLSTAGNLAFGLPVALLDPTSIIGGLGAFRFASGGLTAGKASTAAGRIAVNIGEGLAISTVAETGLALASDRTGEEVLTNIAAGAVFDSVAGGIWEALFRGAGRATPADIADRAGKAASVERIIREEAPPAQAVEALQQRADGYAARQTSEEFKSQLDATKYLYIPSYKDRNGSIRIVSSADDYAAINDPKLNRGTGFLVVNQKTGITERFLRYEEYQSILASEGAARAAIRAEKQAAADAAAKAARKAGEPAVTSGLDDDIDPTLTLDDFSVVESKSGRFTNAAVGQQTGWLSNFGLERSKNGALNLIFARTFERILPIKGWANGRVRGFASYETRRKMHQAKQSRIRKTLEEQVRRVIWQTASFQEKAALKSHVSNEILSSGLLEKRQVVLELLELRRLARLLKVENYLLNPASTREGLAPDAAKARSLLDRHAAVLEKARAIGLPDDPKAYRVETTEADIEFLEPEFVASRNDSRLGRQTDTARRNILRHYARVRLQAEEMTFDGVIALLGDMQGRSGAPAEVVLKNALKENIYGLGEFDLRPENRNSPMTLHKLQRYFNEHLGGYVAAQHVPAVIRHIPEAKLSSMVSLDAYMEFIDSIEAWTVYRQALREMAVADKGFGSRNDVKELLARLDRDTDQFLKPENWDEGTPPYGSVRQEIQDMLRVLQKHATDVATTIKNDKGGVERVTKVFTQIRRKLGFLKEEVSDFERKAADIGGNATRSMLLTMSGVSQVPDTLALLTVAQLNGVQGSIRQTLRGMLVRWNAMGDQPAMRNALFRGLALTGETSTSFATQRFSAANYELDSSRVLENTDFGTRTRGFTEGVSAVVSHLSMTNFMNMANKGGALMGTLHELIDPEVGVLLKLETALKKFDEAKATELIPFLQAEGVNPEFGELVLRTLNRNDIAALSKKIRAGEFDEVQVKRRFGFLGVSDDTLRLIGEPQNAAEAEAVEKLAQTVNYLIDRKIAVPGWIEANSRPSGFFNEMGATFLKQPMAVATRILIGSTYRPSLVRFSMLMAMLGGSIIVGFAKALLRGKEAEFVQSFEEHPARMVMDRLAWAGAFGVLGEKVSTWMLDATAPEAYKRMNAGQFQTMVPIQGVLQTYAKGFGGVANSVFNGDELSKQDVNALWRMTIIGETTIARGIQRVFGLMADEEDAFEAKRYFEDALDATVGVKEGNSRK